VAVKRGKAWVHRHDSPDPNGTDGAKVLDHLTATAKHSQQNEPGVLKYMVFLPTDPSDSNTVWAIEE
jgi:hypothetical protein